MGARCASRRPASSPYSAWGLGGGGWEVCQPRAAAAALGNGRAQFCSEHPLLSQPRMPTHAPHLELRACRRLLRLVARRELHALSVHQPLGGGAGGGVLVLNAGAAGTRGPAAARVRARGARPEAAHAGGTRAKAAPARARPRWALAKKSPPPAPRPRPPVGRVEVVRDGGRLLALQAPPRAGRLQRGAQQLGQRDAGVGQRARQRSGLLLLQLGGGWGVGAAVVVGGGRWGVRKQ